MTLRLKAPLFILFLVPLLCSLGWADSGNLEKDLKSDYVGKTLTLRRFYHGDDLKFKADGTLEGDAAVGSWTVDGQIQVEKLQLKGSALELQGRRLNIVFDSNHKPIDQLNTLDRLSGKARKDFEKSLRERQVRIEIDFPTSSPNQDEIGLGMHAVFLMLGESMVDIVPPFWKSFIAGVEGKHISLPRPPEGMAYKVSPPGVKGGVSAPQTISAPDPEYSELARRTKYSGTTVLWMVVNVKGEPQDIRTVYPLGLGLDEKALDAISTWRFEPAKKDGEPVPVQINVEVSFRLY